MQADTDLVEALTNILRRARLQRRGRHDVVVERDARAVGAAFQAGSIEQRLRLGQIERIGRQAVGVPLSARRDRRIGDMAAVEPDVLEDEFLVDGVGKGLTDARIA